MRALRAGVIAVAVVVGLGSWTGGHADGTISFLGQNCPAYGGWVLYHSGPGGSGGIEGVYTASHGDCVSFFVQNPGSTFITVVAPNPQP